MKLALEPHLVDIYEATTELQMELLQLGMYSSHRISCAKNGEEADQRLPKSIQAQNQSLYILFKLNF